MSQHAHTWKVDMYLLLALPRDSFGDRFTQWTCSCGAWCVITGDVKLGTPLYTPEWWDNVAQQEARRPTAEGRAARREQQWRVG